MTLEKIEEIRRKRIKTYHVLDFTLDSARDNEALHITGSYIYVLNLDGVCSIRLNESSSDSIDLLKFRVVNSPFYRFFLTHPSQAGKILKLALGVESEFFSLQDFQSPDMASMASDISDLKKSQAYNYGTQVAKSGVANNSTVIVHTVSSGKTLLLDHANLCAAISVGGSGLIGEMSVRDASDVTQYKLLYFIGGAVGGAVPAFNGQSPLSIPESYDIFLYSNHVYINACGFIKGREI